MKILNLIVTKKDFDEIIRGQKTQEFREIRPTSAKKYCSLDQDGNCKMEDGRFLPRHYDAIRFKVGYAKNTPTALVEVKEANIELFVDEKDEFISYEINGKYYLAAQVVYDLGNVIEE